MKTTLSQLRSLIREEATRALREARRAPADAPSARCPYVAGATPEELQTFMSFQGHDPADLAEEILAQDPSQTQAEVTALCCMVNSYDEAVQVLVGAGALPEEAEKYLYEGSPQDEAYVYKRLKPWMEYFAGGGKCQHAGGHV
jgi:hypothetical protein